MSDAAKRQFGEYKCPKCYRRWKSANTWPGLGQDCSNCKINVLPFYRRPLNEPYLLNRNSQSKPHLQELCPKCKSLGYDCSTIV